MQHIVRFHTRAETILEVVIAISVIMIILAPASALYIASIRTSATNRNDLVAAALAEEGIEIVRNIRDTNFIKFSDKARDCWNTKPEELPAGTDCFDAGNKIAAGTYRLTIDVANGNWALESLPDPLNDNLAGANDEKYRLTLDADSGPECANPAVPNVPPNCHVHFRDDTHLYYHAPAAAPGGPALPEPSPFYREVTIAYQNDDMYVTSRTLYRNGTAIRQVSHKTILTNQ